MIGLRLNMTPKSSIRPDRVKPQDILERHLVFSCEDCTYFKNLDKKCVLGMNTAPHLKEAQILKMQLSGQMLLCRFLEID